ncbi:DUF1028 domain-containing protein [candidate division GN15 bacterium]|nr:DUF1028 domain-containing protein [candidate division GN15 bacterium]
MSVWFEHFSGRGAGNLLVLLLLVLVAGPVTAGELVDENPESVATFSIVARDSATGELGVAVASRFFAVGSVVPWARADIGAVATQAYANTTFGPRGLVFLEAELTPQEALQALLEADDKPTRRQVGLVDASGRSASYTGSECLDWAGSRNGPNYAVQGNILAGEEVVVAMEEAFLTTEGTLAERMYASLLAGEEAGGDSRGKQSAAIVVVRQGAGYGGYTDRAIDIRVDDHEEPFKELGRLLQLAQVNYAWNDAWTLFTQERYEAALPYMEKAAQLAPDYAEVFYDLGVIRLANDDRFGALEAMARAFELNPNLIDAAMVDDDLAALHDDETFLELVGEPAVAE